MVFSELHPGVQGLLEKRGFTATDVQRKAIPRILKGASALVISPTGSGKTETALLPALSMLLGSPPDARAGIKILYITPLRALNRDMLERVKWWGENLDITVDVRHGDTPTSQRSRQTREPPQLLITTPETLCAILAAPIMGEHLCNVRWVIIDEVHELAASKRGAQLSLALERLAERATFQRMGLSATVGEPKKVAAFFGLKEVIESQVERGLDVAVEFPQTTAKDKELSQRLASRPEAVARLRRLKQLVDEKGAVLTFVNTRQAAEMLASRFEAWDKNAGVGVHHSSLSKDVRVVAEKKFKEGEFRGLIATSSLELGIDIGRIDFVAQYMSPRQPSRLLQRVGRSGHNVGGTARGSIIADDWEDALEAAVICKLAKEGKLEAQHLPEKPLDVLAHQLVGLAIDFGKIKIQNAYKLVTRAAPYASLTLGEFGSVLRQMASERILWVEGDEFGKRKASFLYYYFNLTMIPDEQKFFVVEAASKKNVAVLDEAFVADNLYPGAVFICRGMPWEVLDIVGREVLVALSSDIAASIPTWEGEQIPVPQEVAQGFALRDGMEYLSPEARREVESAFKKQEKHFTPRANEFVIEVVDDYVVVHSFFGSLINETIGKYVSILLTSFLGETVGVRTGPYCIVFEFEKTPRPDLVKKFLSEPAAVDPVLERSLLHTQMFRFRFVHVARRFGLIEKEADYQKISIRRLIGAVLDSPVYAETLAEIKREKLDVRGAQHVLDDVMRGTIKVHERKGEPSYFAKHGLASVLKSPDLVMPERPEAQIIDMMRRHVLDLQAKLYCTYCHNITYSPIRDLPEKIRCNKCRSSMVAFVKDERESYDLLEKRKTGYQMNAEQKRRVEEIVRTADLINAYGRRAVIVLSGKGIGPETAARLLARRRVHENDVYKDMLEAQRNYFKTKRFWT
ncbi:DEAD/DEAH box helicase [Candidatus Micrarchaeota archaeon]|nr:DEAD/DEAH box helicase [Candidatus Micrarchaeota archaeon]